MKLINQYYDLSDAEAVATKLKNKGIITHITSKGSHAISRHRTGVIKVGLWIVLEDQHQDAVAFLDNPNHAITTGLSAEKISEIKKQADVTTYNKLNKFLVFAFSSVAIILFVLYLLI